MVAGRDVDAWAPKLHGAQQGQREKRSSGVRAMPNKTHLVGHQQIPQREEAEHGAGRLGHAQRRSEKDCGANDVGAMQRERRGQSHVRVVGQRDIDIAAQKGEHA